MVKAQNEKLKLIAIPNFNGHLFYQLRLNEAVIWQFRAYEYEPDGISSREIKAPFGLSEGDYEGALKKLTNSVKVA